MSPGTFFLPGPTEVRDDVLQAMLRPMLPHRGAEFETIFLAIRQGLQTVFVTQRPVYISTSSATGLMEAGVRCAPAGTVLSLVNGAFSERFANIAASCGRATDKYEVAWGEVHDPAELDRQLNERSYAAITVVHSETSTGVRNDIRAIANVARRHGVTCLVDSVSGIGGAELRFDEWQLDYVLTGSQKALALPPGLAFAVASESFIQRARAVPGRGMYFDLVEHDSGVRAGHVQNTPAISLFYAAERQLQHIEREGMQARWARHLAMAQLTYRWVDQTRQALGIDLHVLAPAGHRSPTVSTIMLPAAVTGDQMVAAVARRGFTLGSGYTKLKERSIRVGHMGDHTEDGVQSCLDACADALYELTRSTAS
jgi:aspartate aminotransferase-like enzyme